MKARKISVILMTAAILAGTLSMTGCGGQGAPGGSGEEVVIYSNADDEAVEAMKKTLEKPWMKMAIRANICSRLSVPLSWGERLWQKGPTLRQICSP